MTNPADRLFPYVSAAAIAKAPAWPGTKRRKRPATPPVQLATPQPPAATPIAPPVPFGHAVGTAMRDLFGDD